MVSLILIIITHSWCQTNWSEGGGQLFWDDSAKYFASNEWIWERGGGYFSIKGEEWEEFVRFSEAQKVYSIIQKEDSTIYVGCGDTIGPIYKFDGSEWNVVYREIRWLISKPLLIREQDGFLYLGLYHDNGITHVIRDPGGVNFRYSRMPRADSIYALIEVGNYLLAGTGGDSAYIYREEEVGGEWDSPFVSFNDTKVLTLAKIGNTVYAGTGREKGLVLKSTDEGESWQECGKLGGVKSVYCFTNIRDTIYAGGDSLGSVYFTTDEGESWMRCSGINGAVRVKSMVYVEEHSVLIAGCECSDGKVRVFISPDGGRKWINYGEVGGASEGYSLIYTYEGNLLMGTNDEGRIYKSKGFEGEGIIISSIYYTKDTIGCVYYDSIKIKGEIEEEEVEVKVRSFREEWIKGETVLDSTSWEEIEWKGGLNFSLEEFSAVEHGAPYIQYMIKLKPTNKFLPPIVEEVELTYRFAPKIISAEIKEKEWIEGEEVESEKKVVIEFNKPIDTTCLTLTNIDSVLKLSNNHSWLDTTGSISSLEWDSLCQQLTIILGEVLRENRVLPGDTIFPHNLYDTEGNFSPFPCIIQGYIGAIIDSIIAYEGEDSLEYIDNDDYVTFYFSKRTNKPKIDATNIDEVFYVPNKTWLNGYGELGRDSCEWDEFGFTLTCFLNKDSLYPTIEIGDSVYPDSVTIWDKFELYPVVSPRRIRGSFGEYGPIIEEIYLQEGAPEEKEIGEGDFIFVKFNKVIDTTLKWWKCDLDTILIPIANGDTHTWSPILGEDSILTPYVQAMRKTTSQGRDYTLLYIYFDLQVGVEEGECRNISRIRIYPTLFIKGVWIEIPISPETNVYSLGSSNSSNSIKVGDTIWVNPQVIKDLEGREGKGYGVLVERKGKYRKLTVGVGKNKEKRVKLKVYSVAGKLVWERELEVFSPGYKFYWRGKDNFNSPLPPGIYFLKVTINSQVHLTQKLVKLK